MMTDQRRAEFEAWWASRKPAASIKEDAFAAYQAGQAALRPQTLNVDDLAQEIRRVDGRHDLGAGALAEALMPFRPCALRPQCAARQIAFRKAPTPSKPNAVGAGAVVTSGQPRPLSLFL